jgi:hypothetical protein
LIEKEKKLLSIVGDLHKSVDQYLISAYVLAVLITLVRWDLVSKLNVFGADVPIKGTSVLLLISIAVATVYGIVCGQIGKITSVSRLVHANTNELVSMNPNSEPITICDLHLFGTGLMGLILTLVRWKASSLAENPVRFYIPKLEFEKVVSIRSGLRFYIKSQWDIQKQIFNSRIESWLLSLIIVVLLILIPLFLPLFLVAYYVFIEFFYHKQISLGYPLTSLLLLSVSMTGLLCTITVLVYSYLSDLRDALVASVSHDFRELNKQFYEEKKRLLDILRRNPAPPESTPLVTRIDASHSGE